jgi:hypothetical protein
MMSGLSLFGLKEYSVATLSPTDSNAKAPKILKVKSFLCFLS